MLLAHNDMTPTFLIWSGNIFILSQSFISWTRITNWSLYRYKANSYYMERKYVYFEEGFHFMIPKHHCMIPVRPFMKLTFFFAANIIWSEKYVCIKSVCHFMISKRPVLIWSHCLLTFYIWNYQLTIVLRRWFVSGKCSIKIILYNIIIIVFYLNLWFWFML